MNMNDEQQLTVANLIDILSAMPPDALVYAHDLDTDWSIRIMQNGVYVGQNKYGDGVPGAVMIKAEGY